MLVGHVTKDGSLAGPRTLEHMVDTVLSFEGDRHHALRLLQAVKHRFGPTGELGLFEMGDQGLNRVADPGGSCSATASSGVPGGVVLPAMQGRRTLLVELQALVTPMGQAQPKRAAVGLDGGRLAMTLAVLEPHAGLPVLGVDVFASVAGGIRVTEPAADLAVALAVASATTGVALPADLAAVGEVGLAGEVRQVTNLPRRLEEAARLGFDRVVGAGLVARTGLRGWSWSGWRRWPRRCGGSATPPHDGRADPPVTEAGGAGPMRPAGYHSSVITRQSSPLSDALAMVAPGPTAA